MRWQYDNLRGGLRQGQVKSKKSKMNTNTLKHKGTKHIKKH